jgi:MraZ protein
VVEHPSTSLAAPGSTATVPLQPSLGRFTDTVEQAVDAKFRVTLPASARVAFAEGGVLSPWPGPCVAAMTAAGFERYVEQLRLRLPASGFDKPGAHLALAHAQSSAFKPDMQGRFLLPERFRFFAGIDREVTVVGAGSRVEFWNPATYGFDLDDVRQNLAYVQQDIDFDLDPGAGA